MENVFLHLFNMSITAGWLVLAVVVLRLLLKKAPKWLTCLLWVLVAVRLVCPFSIESVLSLIPSAETVPPDTFFYETPVIDSGVPVVDSVINPVLSGSLAPTPMNSVNPTQVLTFIAALVWVAGMVAMAIYALVSTLRLRYKVRESVHLERNIRQCDHIATPFILGVFRPRIYLPTLLGAAEAVSVTAHEQAHLSRRDHWWKPLGFLLLTVYWFNPLLWVGYVLLCRDIEAACDQRVVRDMDAEGRKEYSRVLLACSAPRHLVTACPLAFGETGVKSRVKSVLNYKKPAFWLVITAIVATVVAAVCLLTNPATDEPTDTPVEAELPITQAILTHSQVESGPAIFACESHEIYTTVEEGDKTTVYALVYYHEYTWENDALVERSGSLGPVAITFRKSGDVYDVVEYWTPGENWAEDIRSKFPEAYRERALDYANYPVERMKQECLAKAYAYFGSDRIYDAPLTFSSMNHLPKDKSAKLFAKLPISDAIQYLPVIPMTNRGELDAFIAEYKEDMHFDRAEGDGLTPAHQMSFYDDAFFADHVLLAVYYQNGSCSVQPKIGGISYVFGSTELTVQVDVYEPEAGDTALGQWFMLCEVNRAAIPNVQNYTAVVRSHLPTDQYAAAFTNMVLEKDLPGYTEAWRTRLTDDAKIALRQLLADRQWKYTSIYSRTFAFIGAFDLDGSLYYVTVDYDAVYKDGKMFDLTDAEGRFFRDLYKNTVVANTFTGRVTQVTAKAMLMECYDKDKFTAVWVSLQNIPTANPKVGEEYVVTHTGLVEETYPPQVTALRIIPVSSTPTVGTTTTTAFTPKPKTPAQLSAKQEAEIKQCWVSLYVDPELEHTVDAVEITYYGTYNGYVALIIKDNYWVHLTAHSEEEIAGVLFEYPTSNCIQLWKNGEFFEVAQVYKNGKITQTDVQNIAYYYSNRLGATNTTKATTTTTTTTTLPTSTIVNKIVSPVSVGSTPYEGVSGKSIPYKEVQDLGFQIVPESWVETGIVGSYQQLKTQTGGTAGSLAPLLGKYNEAFFQDYALVVVSYNETIPIYSPDYDINYVSDLIVNGDTLSILLLLGGPKPPENVKDWPTEMYQNNLVLEVKKDDIKTIKKIVPLRMVEYPA